MRKKNFLWTMAAALAFVSCSQDELLENPTVQEQNAIAFSSYLGDNAQGRAVIMDKALLGVEGFGVNAWYTPNGEELSTTEAPDFMQNTKVTYNKDKERWEYSPVKYWPNNTGDKVSFFAYGPYANGSNEYIKLNGTDITFTVADEVKNQVDLIYNDQNIAPTTDLEKPAVNKTVNFTFAHALARIAFTVEAAVDEVTNGNNLLDGNTRINVKKVALVSDAYDADTYPQAGPFYTNNTFSLVDGTWGELTGGNTQGFVFNATEHFYHTVKDVNAEDLEGEKIDVVQLTRFNASEPQRLLNDSSYLMVIPQEATFKIYIEYDVISEGNDNDGDGNYDSSAITNKITSVEPLTVDFIQGKAYNFNLVLGMTSVKFEVDAVTDWNDPQPGEEEWIEEDLPENEGEGNPLLLNTYAEDMNINDVLTIEQQVTSRSEGAVLEFSDFDDSILSYNEETKEFTAIAAGQTYITVSCEGYDNEEVLINVLPSVNPTTLTNKIKTVSITGDTFTMGNDYDPTADMPNAPEHSVSVGGFQIGQYEVSVAQFVEFLNANSENFSIVDSYEWEGTTYDKQAVVYQYNTTYGEETKVICELDINNITGSDIASLSVEEGKGNLPVVCSWEGAAWFAESVGGYLPHEKEWEYAARGRTSSKYVWWHESIGYNFDGTYLYLPEPNDEKMTLEELKDHVLLYENIPLQTVEAERPETISLREIGTTQHGNAWGVYDLHGNLQEWCGNYSYDYLGDAPEDQVNHMVRGRIPYIALWGDTDACIGIIDYGGVAFRDNNTGMNETGFRVAFASDYSGGNSDVKQPTSNGEE